MPNWREMLTEAKELFEDGLINDAEYDQMRKKALALRSQSTNLGATPPATLAIQGMNTIVDKASLAGYQIPVGVNSLGTIVGQQPMSSIGKYKLLEQIGQGSFGTVYRARHQIDAFAEQTGDVVIKLMNSQFAHDDTFRQRFITEAATGRNIQHPNVVRIHDVIVEEHSNILAIVMELVEGRLLGDLISGNGMPFEQALPIIEQLSDALDHIHSQNIIHRDLKPSNIIVTASGKPVILDMGIAKNTDSNLKMTRTSTPMGTPIYMAPEQMDAKNVTSAADRYAFGLIVYQMLSGRLPWDNDSGLGMIIAHKMMRSLIPLKDVVDLGDRISDAVMGLLCTEYEKRTVNCQRFLAELLQQEVHPIEIAVSKRIFRTEEDEKPAVKGDDIERLSILGDLSSLIEVLRSGDEVSKERAAAALWNLSRSEANGVEIVRLGGRAPLVEVFRNANERAREHATQALMYLADRTCGSMRENNIPFT